MKIKCVDTGRARSNLESVINLGRQHTGLKKLYGGSEK